jgi:carbon-monoxide dehydrogenase medium subunit
MIPGKFAYHAPATTPEAIALLQQFGGDAKVLAGGQSLIPLMRFRLTEPANIVDIGRLDGLSHLEERNGHLVIGALATERALEHSPLVRGRYPLLADASAVIADPLVRNLATVGGNVAHADPANDHPAAMLALRAEAVAEGPNGRRAIPIDDFFVEFFTTALEPDELLVELRIPKATPRSGGAYVKFERKVGDYAIAAVAAQLALDDSGRIAEAGIALTNAGPVPVRSIEAEDALRGAAPSVELFEHAAVLAANRAEPDDDLRGPADYKRSVIRTLTQRALATALARAGGAL